MLDKTRKCAIMYVDSKLNSTVTECDHTQRMKRLFIYLEATD